VYVRVEQLPVRSESPNEENDLTIAAPVKSAFLQLANDDSESASADDQENSDSDSSSM